MKIFIAAHYNLNNGDRALLEATVQILLQIVPNAEITVSAYKPQLLIDKRFKTVGWALGDGIREKVGLKLSRVGFLRSIFRKSYKICCDKSYLEALNDASSGKCSTVKIMLPSALLSYFSRQ